MFELPRAKRVKGSKLIEENVVPIAMKEGVDAGPEIESSGLDYRFEYDIIPTHNYESVDPVNKEETFQFNLFRPATKPKSNVEQTKREAGSEVQTPLETSTRQLISIRSPSPVPESNQQGNIKCERPDSFYFTSALSTSILDLQRSQFKASAITGSTVLLRSRSTRWPGTAFPWRVVHLPAFRKQVVTHKAGALLVTNVDENSAPPIAVSRTTSRARPSKKRRDLLRNKAEKRRALIDLTKSKEEHEREKKNKKNRERKLKRRAKERKEKKAGKTGPGSEQPHPAESEDEAG